MPSLIYRIAGDAGLRATKKCLDHQEKTSLGGRFIDAVAKQLPEDLP